LDVIERLRSMQDGASPARALDPAKLWERGTRWRRLRVLVTASVMVCLLVVAGGSGALLVLGDRAPGSAQTTSPSTVPASRPETIYAVPEWAGEIKGVPLAAITMTDRAGWTGRSTGVAGLTAHGHTYGFLDLPAYMGEETLSPDGRRVAYWAAGTPSGDPNTA